ncbi:MAG: hypothetical protein AB1656_02310 [Candidatus Omnitrophota bacterium]
MKKRSNAVFVFIKNAEGQWKKCQIETNGAEIVQEILLSGDGSKLLWIPSKIPSSVDMSLHP